MRFPARLRDSGSRHWETTILNKVYSGRLRWYWNQDDRYQTEGFLSVQNAIAKEFFNVIPKAAAASSSPSSNVTTMPQIRVQRFPMPLYHTDQAALTLREFTPLFLMLVLCFAFMNTVRLVSIEKEKQLKEAMKIMGLSGWIHYLGWFIRTAIMLSITMVLITALLTV